MANPVILDTGPLVAVLDRRDEFHPWAVQELSKVTAPVISCEPVLSETSHLINRIDPGYLRLCELVENGLIGLRFNLSDQFTAVSTLLRKYRDTPMSLADACLVRMSELYEGATIMTIDSDFLHYRRNGRNVIPLIYPGDKR
ncbi:MAG: PIN domain-containing protein [Opitutaceae bacterium]|jgi:uncharacterized protein|nr:PIN domain-containing protein [Opitutaceae bacterium]